MGVEREGAPTEGAVLTNAWRWALARQAVLNALLMSGPAWTIGLKLSRWCGWLHRKQVELMWTELGFPPDRE